MVFENSRPESPGTNVPARKRPCVETVLEVAAAAHGLGLGVDAVTASPLPGPAGNVEYFVSMHAARAHGPENLTGPGLEDEARRAVAEGPAGSPGAGGGRRRQ